MNRRPKLDKDERLDARARDAAKNLWRSAVMSDPELALQAVLEIREVMRACPEYCVLIRLPDSGELDANSVTLRAPCKSCGWERGVMRQVKGQREIRCAACSTYQYALPLTGADR